MTVPHHESVTHNFKEIQDCTPEGINYFKVQS
jgi:hypothetical protein